MITFNARFFECNYGTSGTPFDKMFGTFRDKLKEKGTSYRGGSEEKVDDKTAAIHDAKATLAGNHKSTLKSFLTKSLKIQLSERYFYKMSSKIMLNHKSYKSLI